jgi:hypothetical protein
MKTRKKIERQFDCVASKHKAQSRIYRKLKGKTVEQEAAHFQDAVVKGPFADMWAKLVADGRKATTSGRLPDSERQSP